jgi:hypothetical protein
MVAAAAPATFASFFLGGFECSTHRRRDGWRLDLLAGTRHDRLALADYQALRQHGIAAARDGLRWHLIETRPGRYDWSSALPMLQAAETAGMQVVWDLCHYGWPDDIDIWSPDFVARFAAFAAAAATLVRQETTRGRLYCLVNEISFWAWAGGETGRINPRAERRGAALKRQLVRAAIAATRAVRAVDPQARFITAEPLIHVEAGSDGVAAAAETYRQAQFEALDLLTGRIEPELGGVPELLDLVGLNYYPDNQWYHGGPPIPLGHHAYRPLSAMLAEAQQRYGRPVLLAETGAEGSARAAWLHYVCGEVETAREAGVPVEGICLYPVLDYPGWDNGRICQTGLLSMADLGGRRRPHPPLARELRRQQALLEPPLSWRAPLTMAAG